MPAAASACVNRSCLRTCGTAGLTPSILTPTPYRVPASPPPPSPLLQWLIVLGMCTHLRHVPQVRASTQPGCDPATTLITTSRPHLRGTNPYNLEMPDHCLLEDGKGARGRQLSVMSWRRQQTEPQWTGGWRSLKLGAAGGSGAPTLNLQPPPGSRTWLGATAFPGMHHAASTLADCFCVLNRGLQKNTCLCNKNYRAGKQAADQETGQDSMESECAEQRARVRGTPLAQRPALAPAGGRLSIMIQ
jgi:hypothetical protein